MSSFVLLSAGLIAVASAAISVPGGSNPTAGSVFQPGLNSVVPAGTGFSVTWQPTEAGCGKKVDIVLLKGPSASQMAPLTYIAQGLDNNGTFPWTPSKDLEPSPEDYGIELVCVETQAYQYSTRFGISNPDYKSGSGSANNGTSTGNTGSNNGTSTNGTASTGGDKTPGKKAGDDDSKSNSTMTDDGKKGNKTDDAVITKSKAPVPTGGATFANSTEPVPTGTMTVPSSLRGSAGLTATRTGTAGAVSASSTQTGAAAVVNMQASSFGGLMAAAVFAAVAF